MANEDFSPKQKTYLDELVATIAAQFTQILDLRFTEERAYTTRMLDERFLEERAYLTQLFRQEIAALRQDLMKLDTREDNDAKASVEQWETFDQRLTELEAAFKKFTAAA